MSATHFSGPVVSAAGFQDANGAEIGAGLKVAEVLLTAADLADIDGNPVTLASPGADAFIVPVMLAFSLNHAGVNFADGDNINIATLAGDLFLFRLSSSRITASASVAGFYSSDYRADQYGTEGSDYPVGDPVVVKCGTNFSGGDGATLRISMLYYEVAK